eukprot:6489860-Amphidinium_carterae.1
MVDHIGTWFMLSMCRGNISLVQNLEVWNGCACLFSELVMWCLDCGSFKEEFVSNCVVQCVQVSLDV